LFFNARLKGLLLSQHPAFLGYIGTEGNNPKKMTKNHPQQKKKTYRPARETFPKRLNMAFCYYLAVRARARGALK
jgi:hypothetical protein